MSYIKPWNFLNLRSGVLISPGKGLILLLGWGCWETEDRYLRCWWRPLASVDWSRAWGSLGELQDGSSSHGGVAWREPGAGGGHHLDHDRDQGSHGQQGGDVIERYVLGGLSHYCQQWNSSALVKTQTVSLPLNLFRPWNSRSPALLGQRTENKEIKCTQRLSVTNTEAFQLCWLHFRLTKNPYLLNGPPFSINHCNRNDYNILVYCDCVKWTNDKLSAQREQLPSHLFTRHSAFSNFAIFQQSLKIYWQLASNEVMSIDMKIYTCRLPGQRVGGGFLAHTHHMPDDCAALTTLKFYVSVKKVSLLWSLTGVGWW